MTEQRVWRPIAECPPDLRRAVVFDPDGAWLAGGDGSVVDERVATADRLSDGSWWVDDHQGGASVEPTHFLDPGVPDGFPASPDPEALRIRAEVERVEAERRRERWAVERAEANAAADAERERYWAEFAAEARGRSEGP